MMYDLETSSKVKVFFNSSNLRKNSTMINKLYQNNITLKDLHIKGQH